MTRSWTFPSRAAGAVQLLTTVIFQRAQCSGAVASLQQAWVSVDQPGSAGVRVSLVITISPLVIPTLLDLYHGHEWRSRFDNPSIIDIAFLKRIRSVVQSSIKTDEIRDQHQYQQQRIQRPS
ncbi:hypothetical protein RRG08_060307 [Elysia crispata]|uniref:Uncharacterized protein n=1 Tax=Elysia crispata TaxID=231223 RepID=A0AAE0Y2Z3_9GAST|nr:hypothetical protein RRG08_060307 [Elysia crispata]